jgi:hypothetical protein
MEVQFRGNFGASANLEIDGPDVSNFIRTDPVSGEGHSYNYHFNWNPHDPQGNADAGVYTFRVNGTVRHLWCSPRHWTADCLDPTINRQL